MSSFLPTSKSTDAHDREAHGLKERPCVVFLQWFMVVGMTLFTLGCRPGFSGKIAVQNETGQPLKEVQVRGFRRNPPMGSLGVGSGGAGWMDPMPLPATARISWKSPDGRRREVAVDLRGMSPIPDGTLVFEIRADDSVKAKFDP